MSLNDFRFVHGLRVRWAEVDMQKIVFNAHYLMYFDTAITGYWRALALPYEQAMAQLGGELYVKKASVEFHGSARFDDRLNVALKCQRIGTSSMVFSGAIFRGEVLLITCELVYVFADPASQTSRPVPPLLRQLIERYEAGDAVLEIRTGGWAELGIAAANLRAAFVAEEPGSAIGMADDEANRAGLHTVAFNALRQGVATGRLIRGCQGSGTIGQMVVHHAVRGAGIGQAVLDALLRMARQDGLREVVLQAPRSVEGFYRRQGFLPRVGPAAEAGPRHLEMYMPL